MPQQSFVLRHFSADVQTSSCLKPRDPFMLCLCHCKQRPSDNGGGVRSGPLIFLIGSLQANKRAFFSLAERVKSCWDEASSISGRGGSSSSKVFVGKFEAVCTGFIWLVSHGISLEWLKASGGVLFLSTDIFKAKTALSKPSYSFPSITQHDPFLEKK